MHFENFSDHEMRILNPKTSFAGNVRERNEALYYNIRGNDSKANSALSHNLKGEVSREDCKRIILHSDKISFPINIPD